MLLLLLFHMPMDVGSGMTNKQTDIQPSEPAAEARTTTSSTDTAECLCCANAFVHPHDDSFAHCI